MDCAGTRLRCASTRPRLQLAALKPEAKAGAERRRRFGFASPGRAGPQRCRAHLDKITKRDTV